MSCSLFVFLKFVDIFHYTKGVAHIILENWVAGISALEKLAQLAGQHTFLSNHPDPQVRAELLMQGEDRTVEDEGQLWATLFKYVQTVFTEFLELLRSLVTGLLALR